MPLTFSLLTPLEKEIFYRIKYFRDRINEIEEHRSEAIWDNRCAQESATPPLLRNKDEYNEEEEAMLEAIDNKFKDYRIDINAFYNEEYKKLKNEFTVNKDQLCAEFLAKHPYFEEHFTLRATIKAADAAAMDAFHRLQDALMDESMGVALAPETKAALELAVADADAEYERAKAAKAAFEAAYERRAYEQAAAASVSTPSKASAATLDVPPEVLPK